MDCYGHGGDYGGGCLDAGHGHFGNVIEVETIYIWSRRLRIKCTYNLIGSNCKTFPQGLEARFSNFDECSTIALNVNIIS